MTLIASPGTPSLRQVLIQGQVREAVTGRVLSDGIITVHFQQGTKSGTLDLTLVQKPGGYFAFHCDPSRDLPDFSGGGEVTLRVRLEWPDRHPVEMSIPVPEAQIVPAKTWLDIDGTSISALKVPGAPFEVRPLAPSRPFALEGYLIRDFDPEVPAIGVTVSVPGAVPVTSDVTGRFFIPAIPPAETVTATFSEPSDQDEPPSVEHTFQPDPDRLKTTLTLSLPLASS